MIVLNPNTGDEMGCCSVCPDGGVCEGGLNILPPRSSEYEPKQAEAQVTYYDPENKSYSTGIYYHFAPYADRGYWRTVGDTDDVIESCSPKPRDDTDIKRTAGACLGGQPYEYCKEVQKFNKQECTSKYQ